MPISIVPSPKSAIGVLLLCVACDAGPAVEQAQQSACVIEVDLWGGPEAIDGRMDHRTLRYFDGNGRVEREEFDTNGDGGSDQFAVHYYNDDGRGYLWERFHSASLELTSREERAFDDEGREVLRSWDRNGDGIIDQTTVTLFQGEEIVVRETGHDRWGRVHEVRWGRQGILESTTTSASENRRVTYSYNNRGLQARIETFSDGVLESAVDHRYNEVGHKTTSLFVQDGVESLQTFSHDERGFVTGWVNDKGRDGSIDSRAVCTFDDEGRMTSEHVDNDNDGDFDYIETSSFDEYGRLLHSETGADDGRGGEGRIVSYQYDCL